MWPAAYCSEQKHAKQHVNARMMLGTGVAIPSAEQADTACLSVLLPSLLPGKIN